jgi:hypothetical protein
MTTLLTHVNTLVTTIGDLQASSNAAVERLGDLQNKYIGLKEENRDLKKAIDDMKAKLENKKKEVFTEGNCSHLLIGDSLLRSIDESKLVNTVVRSMPGADAADVMHKMNEIDDIFMDVTICVGSNDCSDEDFEPKAVTDTYSQLVAAATEKVKDVSKVTVVSVPPRTDHPDKQQRVEALNASLCALAQETGVKFVNNDPVFILSDGSPNDGYLCHDGVHLNNAGTNKLAKNMKLRIKDWHRGNACKDNRANNQGPTKSSHRPNTSRWTNTKYSHGNAQYSHGNTQYSHGNAQYSHGNSSRSCWNCAETNHISRNCHHGKRVKCRNCQQLGHKVKFCQNN